MDNFNKTLELSIQQDIIIINSIIKRIDKITNFSDVNSWLFPLKNYKVVEEDFLCKKKLQNLTYEKILEVLLDRACVFAKLLQIFLIKPSSNSKTCDLRRSQNQYLSFGCVFENLWTITLEFAEKMKSTRIIKSERETDHCEKYHKETQTEVISKRMCDSCATSALCMKTLVNFFENYDQTFKKERIFIRSKIFDITQFGCMLQVTSTIQEYLNSMCEQLNKQTGENLSIKKEKDLIKKELDDKHTKTSFLETEIKILKEELENEKLDNIAMRQEISDLKKHLKEKTQTISYQNDSVAKINIEIFKIRKENDCLKSQLKKQQNLVEEATDFLKISNYQYNFRDQILTNELKIMGKCLEEYEKFVDLINTKYIKSQKILGKFENKFKHIVELSENNHKAVFMKTQEFCKKVKEMVKERIEKENQKGFKILGNPLEDFPKQIEENETKIKCLQAENFKLESLLDRFKKSSSKNSLSTN